MRSKTNNVRRATQDLDIDFIKYSLADESIDAFLHDLAEMDEDVQEFTDDLWFNLLDHVTVFSKKDVRLSLCKINRFRAKWLEIKGFRRLRIIRRLFLYVRQTLIICIL